MGTRWCFARRYFSLCMVSNRSGVRMTPVLVETHRDLGFRPETGFLFARRVTRLPLAVWEIGRIAQAMPVIFEQHQGRWQAVAIMGTSYGLNAHVAPDGRWCTDVVPITFQLYPFCTDDTGRLCLAEGVSTERRDLPGVTPFFEGEVLAPRIRQAARYLSVREKGIAGVERALDALSRCKALQPLDRAKARRFLPDATGGDSCILDAKRLAALDDETALMLFRSGALHWLYAHLDSLHHLDRLERRAKAVMVPNVARVAEPSVGGKAADVVSALAEDMGDAYWWLP